MNLKTAIALLVLAFASAAPEAAMATDPAPNTKDGVAHTKGRKPAVTPGPLGSIGTGAKSKAKSGSGVSTGNPRSNPANDQNGPRASEGRTDATSSQATPTAERTPPR
ncbi:MAG: hypothetical protein H7Y22_15820 [Gemmatimonadaceae bacterium]|nr:hypothetical protein [Gloeobacterales cyanobacterium ES-bin-141]